MRLLLMILIVIIVCHGAGCLWYMAGTEHQSFADGTVVDGWVNQRWHLRDKCNTTDPKLQPADPECDEFLTARYITSMCAFENP